MRFLFILIMGPILFVTANANDRCLAKPAPLLYGNDFALGCGSNRNCGLTTAQLNTKFDQIYYSGKRLEGRAEYDPKTQSYSLFYSNSDNEIEPFPITEQFIASVTKQIETALAHGFADNVFQADMGHAHLYFEEEKWNAIYKEKFSGSELFKAMFADPSMKVLYHLSEHLLALDENKQVLNDETVRFKHANRNFMATNNETVEYEIPSDLNGRGGGNTVGEIDGYFRHGAGFAISASVDGCFPYRDKNGETRYFDISLYEPHKEDPNSPTYGM